MRLSTRSRYGVRMIVDIAEYAESGPIQLGQVAARQNISIKYLEQIIRPLKRANYIKSFRGAKGGYILYLQPKDIIVGDVVALLEADNLLPCFIKPETCSRSKQCVTRVVWIEASSAFYGYLNKVTIADLLSGSGRWRIINQI